MNGDCLSYVMIFPCIGVSSDCVSGKQMGKLTHGDKKMLNTGVIFFFLSNLLFPLQCSVKKRLYTQNSTVVFILLAFFSPPQVVVSVL